jgi:hypothetical protein
MLERMKSVNNPLTIIALFAALAEIAGTVAIKLVAPDMQPTFIWFVMIFPTLIVVLFFITLNFNAKVLYAPGDFKNEENYLAIQNAKQGLAIENVETMIAEARTKIISEVMKTVSTNGTGDKSKVEEIVNDKLSPIQVAIESVKSFRLYPFSTQKDSNRYLDDYSSRSKPSDARRNCITESDGYTTYDRSSCESYHVG